MEDWDEENNIHGAGLYRSSVLELYYLGGGMWKNEEGNCHF